MSDKSEALRLEAETVSGLMVQLAENDIDSDSFAVMLDLGENGTEHECDLPITETALRAAAVIDQLLAALKEKDQRIKALESAALVPGVLHCAKCLFQLTKTNLYMKSGTTGPGDSKSEPCPNGCGPLWPVTWKQYATDAYAQVDRYYDECKALEQRLQQPAIADVMAERQRQVGAEGYDHFHDDSHVNDEIAALAAWYVMPQGARGWDTTSTGYGDTLGEAILPGWLQPKEKDRRRELVIGAALTLAEIERLDRVAANLEVGR